MKKNILFILSVIFLITILFMNCQQGGGSSGGGGDDDDDDDDSSSSSSSSSINYQMVTVPAINNFPMGCAGVAEPVHAVPSISSFRIGGYEVTYEQWYTVREWAILPANGYTFANPGNEGNSTNQSTPTARKLEPVTTINWRDCIVWCNAASQYEGLTPVYYTDAGFTTPLKTSTNTASINTTAGSEDNPYVNWSANGYRLPTEAEWEACARYVNGTTWLRGDAPSGWIDNNPADGEWRIEVGGDWSEDDVGDNYSEVNAVAWWGSNSGYLTHDVGTKTANQLVIFDMSGNVFEWCWDWYGEYTTFSPYTDSNPKGHAYDPANPYRLLRGGSWGFNADSLQGSGRGGYGPYDEYGSVGLRLSRTY